MPRPPPPLYSFPSRPASIDVLPTDVLTDIFLISCDHKYDLTIGDEILPFQHTLSNVSRRWRTAASQYPTLWSNIRIGFRHTNMALDTGMARYYIWIGRERAAFRLVSCHRSLRRALANTGNALLDIKLDVSGCKTPQYTLDGVVAILQDLVAQCERWRSFTAIVRDIPTDVFNPLYHHIPRLHFLEIDYLFFDEHYRGISHIFADAPRLVDAHCKSDSPNSVFFEMPWAQLHSALLYPSTQQQFIHCLQSISRAPDLRQLTLTRRHSITTGLPLEQPVVLPCVEKLTLPSLDIVPYLRLPSLANLNVLYMASDEVNAVVALLTGSRCGLRALELNSYGSTSIQPLLPHLNRLQVLHLNIKCSLADLSALQECVSFLVSPALREMEVSLGMSDRNAALESPKHAAGAVLGMVWEAICAREDNGNELRRVGVEVFFEQQSRRLWRKLVLRSDRAVVEGLRRCSFEVEVMFSYYQTLKRMKLVTHDILKEAVV